MSETSGADAFGFDPFPGSLRFPGADAIPGDITDWKPMPGTVDAVYRHATERFVGVRDKSLLTLLGKHNIGARV